MQDLETLQGPVKTPMSDAICAWHLVVWPVEDVVGLARTCTRCQAMV